MPSFFTVAPENEAETVAHLTAKGFPPSRIDKDEEGEVVLVFADVPDEQMHKLAQALPVHLSTKLGIVMGDRPPFGT
ncbi:hypothetical protein OK349_12880 [Sphingomonas sp. BT-65]|uniref:hypothetical protein n=1 Tax=Sphingomonas sp. BT-65 TaxID=2989821 RepID=UPI002235BFDF|nr:hypothetical protein [Sphingomonas sp. BT-65]MCW4462605.1 hypothetical protein [Sphingomonas sp. BT-65]